VPFVDFEKVLDVNKHSSPEKIRETFEGYDLYHFPEFLKLIRNLPGYEQFIFYLEDNVNNKKSRLREKLKRVDGFIYKDKGRGPFGSHKTKYGFHKWVHHEKDRILQENVERQRQEQEEQRQQQIEREREQQIRQAESRRIEKIYKDIDAQQYSLDQLKNNPNRSSTVEETRNSLTVIQQNLDYEEITPRTENLIDLGFLLLESDDCIAEQDAVHLVQTLENPDQFIQITLSQESVRLFGDFIKPYNKNSSDFIERKIITIINNTAEIRSELDLAKEYHRTIHNNLSKAVVTSKTSLIAQADSLNVQDRVEEAYEVARIADTLIHCALNVAIFIDSTVHTFTDQAYKTVQPCVQAILSLFDGMCYTFSHPAEVAESIFSFMSQDLGSDFNYRAEESTELGLHAQSAVINKATSIIDTIQILGSTGAEFAMNYGHAFTTNEDLEGFDAQAQQEIRTLAQEQSEALRIKIVEVAQSITPEQCGKVVGTMTAEWTKFYCIDKGIGWLASSLLNIRKARLASEVVEEVEKIKSTVATKAVRSIERTGVKARELIALEKQVARLTCPLARKALETILESSEAIHACGGIKFVESIEQIEKKFKNVKGYAEVMQRMATRNQKGEIQFRNIKGAFFEFENALRLEQNGQEVVEFGRKVLGVDFDIVTKSAAIECKNWIWERYPLRKIQDDLGRRRKVAEVLKFDFEVHSKSAIPEYIKVWLKQKGIKYCEYFRG